MTKEGEPVDIIGLINFAETAGAKISGDSHLIERYRAWSTLIRLLDTEVQTGGMSKEERIKILTTVLVDKERREEIDYLTGLYNRGGIMARLEIEANRSNRTHQPFSLAFMDLDRFKVINDTYGHDAGDVVLIAWAEYLGKSTRATDILGRAGGEEILAILPGTDEQTGFVVFDRIRSNMPPALEPITKGVGIKSAITMSVGIAQYITGEPLSFGAQDGLIKRADRRMYEAKEAGRDRVVGGILPS